MRKNNGIGGREWPVICAREMRIFSSMRWHLVSCGFMYRDFGKWGREKLVGENGLLSNRNENLFIDERALDGIWSNFMRRDLVSWGKEI